MAGDREGISTKGYGGIFGDDELFYIQYSSSPLSAASLSLVSVTHGQSRYENIKRNIPEINNKF